MSEELEPLPELSRGLLEVERAVPDLPDEVRARMTARMDRFLAEAGGKVAAAAAVAPGGLEAAAPGLVATALKSKLTVTLVALAIGAGAGASIDAVLRAPLPAPPARRADSPPPESRPPVAPVVAAPGVWSAAPLEVAPTATPSLASSSRPAPQAPRESALRRERSLIDTARMAILRGDKAAALETLDRHAREFPTGQHAADREALRRRADALEPR